MKTHATLTKTAFRLLTGSIALYAAALSAQAASVLVQAESFTNAGGAGFVSLLDPTASGGRYATTLGDNTAATPSDLGSFQVSFAESGTYTLYLRALAEGDAAAQGGNDSFFIPATFGAAPTFPERINDIQNTTPDPVPQYSWINIFTKQGLEFGGAVTGGGTSGQYTVGAPGVQTFVIGGRENGLRLDAFVFSTEANLTAAQLNTIAGVPEPTSVLLGAMGLLGLASRRRKQA